MRHPEPPTPQLLPPRLPGVEVVRVAGDTRLWSGVSTRYGVAVVEAGAFDFWYRGRAWTLAPGRLKLKEPGEVHRDLRVHAPVTCQSLSLDVPLVQAAARERGLAAPPPLRPVTEGRGRVEVLGHALHAALRDPATDTLALQSLLTELLAQLLGGGAADEGPVRARRAALRARDVLHAAVEEGSPDEATSLEVLAAAAGLGRFHLLRTFRRELGLTPHAYLTHLRVARARELLARGVSAARAALDVGLYDQSQLHRHFVRIVGVSPGAYARAVRGTSTSPKPARARPGHPRS